MDIGDRVLGQRLGDVGGDLGAQHVGGVLGQDAGDVEGHVADADHSDLLGLQRPGARVVGVAVVPGHEVRGAVGLGQADAGDRQGRVPVGARGDDDRVVVVAQILNGDVAADLDIAQQADIPALEDLVQGDDDLLDARVVGGDPVADQPVGRGEALEQVDAHLEPRLRQDVGRVDSSGAGADDGNVEWGHPSSSFCVPRAQRPGEPRPGAGARRARRWAPHASVTTGEGGGPI